jgi:hypothetical protein
MTEVLRLGEKPKLLDLDVLENGLRRECPWAPGVFFTVLPWGTQNKRYRKAMQLRAMRERAERNGKARSNEQPGAEDLETQAAEWIDAKQKDPEFIADAVLKDIEGLLNEKGNPIKYSRERAVQILSDPACVHIRDWVVGTAHQAANTYKANVEESAKNSGRGSSGKKAGAAGSKKTKGSSRS